MCLNKITSYPFNNHTQLSDICIKNGNNFIKCMSRRDARAIYYFDVDMKVKWGNSCPVTNTEGQ